MRVGIIAGEISGDQLGADLIRALRRLSPDIYVEGIAGPQMVAAGCNALYPMDRLAVMGLYEVLGKLPELLSIRQRITRHFLTNPPDIFIGIDAPDFNLAVECKLKAAQIPTVHYVSPTVWAWRQGRIKKINRAADLLLSILPFEREFYRQHSPLPVQFIGHPLADQLPLVSDRQHARSTFGFHASDKIIAILPGSRGNEINYLGEIFLRTAQWCAKQQPDLTFIAPMANPARRQQFMALQKQLAPHLNIHIVDKQAQEAMAAADVVLLASGTATLEAMLIKRPMVVAYRMSTITYFIAQRLIKTPYIALPNLLAGKMLVPEFIQQAATPENLGHAIFSYLQNPQQVEYLTTEFTTLHRQLRLNASQRAAEAIMKLAISDQ